MTGSAYIPLDAKQIKALRCVASVRTVNLRGLKLVNQEGIGRLEGLKLIESVPDPDYPPFKRYKVTDAGVAWLLAYDTANDAIMDQIAKDTQTCQSPIQTSSSTV